MAKGITGTARGQRLTNTGERNYKLFELDYGDGCKVRSRRPTEKFKLVVDCDFAYEIDVDGIVASLGRKAAFSKSKRSGAMGGLIKVKLLDRRQVELDVTPIPAPAGSVEVKET